MSKVIFLEHYYGRSYTTAARTNTHIQLSTVPCNKDDNQTVLVVCSLWTNVQLYLIIMVIIYYF